ncbi:MAG: hypothetical protein Q8R69_24910 [Telluria sp.]|nr:hypothetical protein [Telluria sp.]
MDSDQKLLDDANAREDAREAAEWKAKQIAKQRYEAAARAAYKVRRTAGLVLNRSFPDFDELGLSSRDQLIADAKDVDENPTMTAEELWRRYQDRLRASGDIENEDLVADLPDFEEAVVRRLKQTLGRP